MIYSNLKQDSSGRLCKSSAYLNLDPSEKSAISYFLGLTSAKLFADQYLSVPWLMHLDVYKRSLRPSLVGQSKPDLVGLDALQRWIIMEAKGRSNEISTDLLSKAKKQTRKLRNLNGALPYLRIALGCHFTSDVLHVDWEDPDEYEAIGSDLEISISRYLSSYYELFTALQMDREQRISYDLFNTTYLEEADLTVGINTRVLEWLNREPQIESFPLRRLEGEDSRVESRKVGNDGILVELGRSWQLGRMREEPASRKA